jgi:hypothetical protein
VDTIYFDDIVCATTLEEIAIRKPAAAAPATDEAEVVGAWKLSYFPGDRQHEPVLTITREGDGYRGKFVEDGEPATVKEVTYKDGTLRFKIESEYNGAESVANFEGKVKGDAIEGACDWEYSGMTGSFDFQGKREESTPKE